MKPPAHPGSRGYRIPFLLLCVVAGGWFVIGVLLGFMWGSGQATSTWTWVQSSTIGKQTGTVLAPSTEPAPAPLPTPKPVDAPVPSVAVVPSPSQSTTTPSPVTATVPSTSAGAGPGVTPKWETVCTNTCPQARNGKCEEGRAGPGKPNEPERIFDLLCDPGSDCEDCGPWDGPPPSKSWTETLPPAAYLASKKVLAQARASGTYPVVVMAYTDPTKDVDVSTAMHHRRAVESGMSKVFVDTLQPKCGTGPGIFVDVGANFGWFTLLAAAMGCRVVAWEPVPLFRAFMELSLQLTRVQHLVELHTNVVANDSSMTYELVVPQRGIWGTAGIGGDNIDPAINNEGDYLKLHLKGDRVDDFVNTEVYMLKVDVEGHEPSAVASASRLFKEKKIQAVMLEYSPGVYERRYRWKEMHVMPEMLMGMVDNGMTILQIPDHVAREHPFNLPMAPLPLVTKANLEYDIKDALRMANSSLGCGQPPELLDVPSLSGCGGLPEDLHPKSFHVEFGHNTNIFAFMHPPQHLIGKPVGIIKPEAPINSWWTERSYGSGGRPCAHLPPEVTVRHHCHCTDMKVCGKEEAAIEKALAAGTLTHLG